MGLEHRKETGQGCSMLVTPRATCELGTQQETGQGCSMLVTPRATCELGTQQGTGLGCSMLVTPRATCGLGTQQETGQGCSMLVTPRATYELGTQQGAALVLTVSTSVTSQQEADHLSPSIILPGIPGAKPGRSVEHTHALCSEAVEEENPQETPMLVTGHED